MFNSYEMMFFGTLSFLFLSNSCCTAACASYANTSTTTTSATVMVEPVASIVNFFMFVYAYPFNQIRKFDDKT